MLRWLLRIWRPLPGPLKLVYLKWRYGRYAVGVAALIRNEQGGVLLVHRTYSREEPWAFPGGWLEGHDEGIERGLERELLEETGLRVQVGAVKAVERSGFAVILLMDTELLDPVAAFRASDEVSDLAWVEPTEAGQLSRLNARLLRRALA